MPRTPSLPGTRLELRRPRAGRERATARLHFFEGVRPEDAVPVDLVSPERLADDVHALTLTLQRRCSYKPGEGTQRGSR